ncbi:hypothetical protein [Candidatus Nitrosocosmicus hydrocola]|jgi:hypothetical protein|uniref:hypothetical protein n=1 Tax=Candidatus Nitrosocosmicus hydrocola TaxID=1826872 RepID=UPI0011E5A23B|nr:hypothetical protein [Candidatus Nitrosocosmicus hydrocola]
MGRWDGNDRSNEYGGSGVDSGKKRNWLKLIRRIIFIGFVVVAIVILYVYFSTSGLNIEIIQRGGPVETISVKLSNNNFFGISNVTVQFDNEQGQNLGNMGPFASIFVTPESGSSNFKQVLVEANNGDIEIVKNR